mmetsp:Transcript_43598/g.102493  ORF Transcript_43598/g.102493 Transcript_43598/m.102493 type:complete len:91 (+) Transcript_43598:97-369(+)
MFATVGMLHVMLDQTGPSVSGIPGLTYNTNTNSNAGNRIQYPTWAPDVPLHGWGGQGGTIDPGPEPVGGYPRDDFGDVVRKTGLFAVAAP